MIRCLLIILITTMLAGCSPDAPSPLVGGIEAEAFDPQSGVVILTQINDGEIASADRLRVEVRIQWASPVNVTLNEPDWAGEGWTRIDASQQPVQMTDSGFELTGSYLIEPFLPGEYTVPSFTAVITPHPDSESYELASPPIAVVVQSVLDSQDSGELDPSIGLLDPRAALPDQPNSKSLIYTIAGAMLISVLLVVWRLSRTSNRSGGQTSVFEQLQHVANGHDESESDAYNTLYNAFTRLDDRLQQTSEIRTLIEQCERARFSRSDTVSSPKILAPSAMARHTLELLGHCDGEAA